MLTEQDLKQIAQKGITEEQINEQLNEFKTGFPFLKLKAAAGRKIERKEPSLRSIYFRAFFMEWTNSSTWGGASLPYFAMISSCVRA